MTGRLALLACWVVVALLTLDCTAQTCNYPLCAEQADVCTELSQSRDACEQNTSCRWCSNSAAAANDTSIFLNSACVSSPAKTCLQKDIGGFLFLASDSCSTDRYSDLWKTNVCNAVTGCKLNTFAMFNCSSLTEQGGAVCDNQPECVWCGSDNTVGKCLVDPSPQCLLCPSKNTLRKCTGTGVSVCSGLQNPESCRTSQDTVKIPCKWCALNEECFYNPPDRCEFRDPTGTKMYYGAAVFETSCNNAFGGPPPVIEVIKKSSGFPFVLVIIAASLVFVAIIIMVIVIRNKSKSLQDLRSRYSDLQMDGDGQGQRQQGGALPSSEF